MRDIHISAHYVIVMKNPRDRTQIDYLGRQMKLSKEVGYAYNDATKDPYGYLVLDFKQDTPSEFRLRTRITTSENIKGKIAPIIYAVSQTK